MSATIACSDFLHTSGQCPASLRMPPACPPMPSAQVLQAFFERIAFHSCHQPTRLAMRRVYRIAAQPPPLFIRFITAPETHHHDGIAGCCCPRVLDEGDYTSFTIEAPLQAAAVSSSRP